MGNISRGAVHVNGTVKSYGGEDLADGSFNLEFSGPAVHVGTDHVGHRLEEITETKRGCSAVTSCSSLLLDVTMQKVLFAETRNDTDCEVDKCEC